MKRARPLIVSLGILSGLMPEIKDRPFVIVSGLPGSGKTTLARQLGSGLGLPVLDKDDFLERLFESKGTGDAAWRRTLSRESDALFQSEATESGGAVLTSFWHLPGMPANSGTPTGWLHELSDLIVNVRCACRPEIAAARFFGRKRHAGHLDQATYAEVLASLEAQAVLDPLNIEPAIDVDTSDEFSTNKLVLEIQAMFTRCPQQNGADAPDRPCNHGAPARGSF